MIGPYKRLRLGYIAMQLNIPPADVQQLLVGLILDERIRGRIDQVLGLAWLGLAWLGLAWLGLACSSRDLKRVWLV